jgi:putative oxidoreductase
MKNLFTLSFLPRSYNLALLVLRLWFGFSLFLKHGWEKITGFSQMIAHFPDPIHIGPVPTFAFALFSDAICSLLLFFGLATRWAALIIAINTGVAFALVHGFRFFGQGNGELPWLYFAAAFAVLIAGPGRFSFDGK